MSSIKSTTSLLTKSLTLPDTSPTSKISLWRIFFLMFFYTTILIAVTTPQLQLFTYIFCERYYEDKGDSLTLIGDGELGVSPDCSIPEIQANISWFSSIIHFLNFACAFLVAGYYGELSDKKGRLVVFRISFIGIILALLCTLIGANHIKTFGIGLLYLSPVLQGLLGGGSILMASIQAYVSDCTLPEERTTAFGQLTGFLYLGCTIGPIIGSFIIKKTGDPSKVIYISIIMSIIILAYTYIIPESNMFMQRNPTGSSYHEDVKKKPTTLLQRINIFSALSILFRTNVNHASRYSLPILATIITLQSITANPPALLYTMYRFNWTAYEAGLMISFISFFRLTIALAVFPLIKKLFHKYFESMNDKYFLSSKARRKKEYDNHLFNLWSLRTGSLLESLGMLLSGMATTSLLFTSATTVHSFLIISGPSIRSLIISFVSPFEVGELLGAITILESFAAIVSQLGINSIYTLSVGFMPELVFYVCTGIAISASTLAFFVHIIPPKSDEEQPLLQA